MMFIEGVDESLYISDPSQLKIGMELWVVGQGGTSTVQDPYLEGTLVAVNHDVKYDGDRYTLVPHEGMYAIEASYGLTARSMLDKHIMPQTYNNWYVCSSKDNAIAINQFLRDAWKENPELEAARQDWITDCHRYDEMDDYDDPYYEEE